MTSRNSARLVVLVGAAVGLSAGGAVPAMAWMFNYNNVVESGGIEDSSTGKWRGKLKDISCNGVAVRAEYGRANNNEFSLANSNGCGTGVNGAWGSSKVVWTIACQDYPIGDDCSAKRYAP